MIGLTQVKASGSKIESLMFTREGEKLNVNING